MLTFENVARYALLPLVLGYIIQRASHIAVGIHGVSITSKEDYNRFIDRYSSFVIRLRIVFSSWAIGLIIVYAIGGLK